MFILEYVGKSVLFETYIVFFYDEFMTNIRIETKKDNIQYPCSKHCLKYS